MSTIVLAIATIIALMSLVAVVTVSSFNKEQVTKAIRVLSLEEHALVKKYAALFGLDNEAVDIDVQQLIEMGRKYEDYLGIEMIDNLFEQNQAFYRSTIAISFKQRANARRCHVNQVVSACSLVNRITCLLHTIFTQIITGGNKDGEPSSSLF